MKSFALWRFAYDVRLQVEKFGTESHGCVHFFAVVHDSPSAIRTACQEEKDTKIVSVLWKLKSVAQNHKRECLSKLGEWRLPEFETLCSR